MKCQNVLDSGLAANDGYFWREVTKKFQEVNEECNNLAYTDFMFVGVNPSIKLQHNWSSFWRFTRLSLNLMVRSLRTLRKVKIMMISSTSVLRRVRCIICICGRRNNLNWYHKKFSGFISMLLCSWN
jgi:hypothetical protein